MENFARIHPTANRRTPIAKSGASWRREFAHGLRHGLLMLALCVLALGGGLVGCSDGDAPSRETDAGDASAEDGGERDGDERDGGDEDGDKRDGGDETGGDEDAGGQHGGRCSSLDLPTRLMVPPNGKLPCDLLPPE